MDTALPSEHIEDDSYDSALRWQYRFKTGEAYFRSLLSNITCSIIFLVASLLVLLLMPFYPTTMAVFLAIIFGIVAFKWPEISLGLLLAFAAPAYAYQLGGIAWSISILAVLAFALPVCLNKMPGAAIGCAAGLAAGVLMFTPAFYLSLPVLASVSFLRLRGSTFSGIWGVFMFLVIYLPFLFINEIPEGGGAVPLFTDVFNSQRNALDLFDLNSIKTAFNSQINGNAAGFPSISAYFFEGWSGIVLIVTIVLTFLVTPGILNLSKRIDESRLVLRNLIPLFSLLIIEFVFLTPLLLLRGPLGYETGFDNTFNIIILTAVMLAMGGTAYSLENWLYRRDLKVDVGGNLTLLLLELYDYLETSRRRLQQMGSVCRNRGLEDEKAILAQWEEKVTLTLESIRALDLSKLEVSWTEFSTIRSQIAVLEDQIEGKLHDHIDNSKRTYCETVNGAIALGMPLTETAINAMTLTLDQNDYRSAIDQQQRLNQAFKELAVSLVSTGEMLADTVKDEIDPEFSLTTIDIGRGFLEQGRYEAAAQTILEDLQIIDGRIESPIHDLAAKVNSLATSFRSVTISHLIPVFELLGDTESLDKCYQTLEKLDLVAQSIHDSGTLADLISIVDQSRKLAQTASNTVSELRNKIAKVEADNDRRCPSKYKWGRNTHLAGETQQLLNAIEASASGLTISSRISIIEKAVQAIEQQAKIIRDYSLANEFLINFPIIETIINTELEKNGQVDSSNIPVVPKYGTEYLKMYSAKYADDVMYESKSGRVALK